MKRRGTRMKTRMKKSPSERDAYAIGKLMTDIIKAADILKSAIARAETGHHGLVPTGWLWEINDSLDAIGYRLVKVRVVKA